MAGLMKSASVVEFGASDIRVWKQRGLGSGVVCAKDRPSDRDATTSHRRLNVLDDITKNSVGSSHDYLDYPRPTFSVGTTVASYTIKVDRGGAVYE